MKRKERRRTEGPPPLHSRLTARAPRGRVRYAVARLGVVVQLELVRMRPQADRVDLFRHLAVDPGLDQVLGEDVALEQEVVVRA